MEIIGLFDANADQKYLRIQPMLDEYAANSSGNLTVRYIDPDRTPGVLKEIDPQDLLKPEAGEFVVYSPETGKGKNVTYYDIFDIGYDESYNSYLKGIKAEQSFTGAIKYVTAEVTPVVYFTTGHDEIKYSEAYSSLVMILANNNYDVKELDLFSLEETRRTAPCWSWPRPRRMSRPPSAA